MRILLAEDDRVSRHMVEKLVAKWGHKVVSCSDGAEALNLLNREDAPQLAILDWMMPEMSGIEVCRALRASGKGKHFYIILFTTRQTTEDLAEGLKAGADDYIRKPVDAVELEARVQAGLRILSLKGELVAAERLKTLMAAAGAAAHEINQPLTVLMGTVEIWRQIGLPDEGGQKRLNNIYQAACKIRDIVIKMSEIDSFVVKPYVGSTQIIDFEAASSQKKK